MNTIFLWMFYRTSPVESVCVRSKRIQNNMEVAPVCFKLLLSSQLMLSVKVTRLFMRSHPPKSKLNLPTFHEIYKIKCLSAPSMNCERTHHHKMITQTWQKHERKEMEVREKLLSQLKGNIFSCEWSLNVSWQLFFMHQSPLLEPSSVYPSGKKNSHLLQLSSSGYKNTGFFFPFTANCGQRGFTSLTVDFNSETFSV